MGRKNEKTDLNVFDGVADISLKDYLNKLKGNYSGIDSAYVSEKKVGGCSFTIKDIKSSVVFLSTFPIDDGKDYQYDINTGELSHEAEPEQIGGKLCHNAVIINPVVDPDAKGAPDARKPPTGTALKAPMARGEAKGILGFLFYDIQPYNYSGEVKSILDEAKKDMTDGDMKKLVLEAMLHPKIGDLSSSFLQEGTVDSEIYGLDIILKVAGAWLGRKAISGTNIQNEIVKVNYKGNSTEITLRYRPPSKKAKSSFGTIEVWKANLEIIVNNHKVVNFHMNSGGKPRERPY